MAKYKLVVKQWDQVISKPTEPFQFTRHRKGDTVDLSGADERRLVRIGAVEAVKRSGGKAPSKTPQDPATTPVEPVDPQGNGDGTPGDPPADPGSTEPESPVDLAVPETESGGDATKPTKTAPVAAWREYAVSQGHGSDEAAVATRADLIALYG